MRKEKVLKLKAQAKQQVSEAENNSNKDGTKSSGTAHRIMISGKAERGSKMTGTKSTERPGQTGADRHGQRKTNQVTKGRNESSLQHEPLYTNLAGNPSQWTRH